MALTVTPAELTATALTLTTAAQPNITSVGTLSGLTTAGITMSNGGDRALTGPLNQSLLINARPNDATEGLKLQINGANKLSVLQNGSITVGGAGAPRTVGWGDTKLQIEGTGATDSSISLIRNAADNNPPYFVFAKSRTGSIGSNTVVQDNDYLGVLRFNGADGTDLGNVAAQIHTEVDGTPATDDIPGALVFSTSNVGDGSAAAIERLRIDSSGNVGIGTATPSFDFEINRASAAATVLINSGNNDAMLRLYTSNNVGKWRMIARTNNKLSFENLNSGATAFDNRLTIDSTGIATFKPGIGDLSIKNNDSSPQSGIILEGVDANHAIYFRRGRDGTLNTMDFHEYDQFRFFTGGAIASQTERMRITDVGNVGIGRTPSTAVKLDIQGASNSTLAGLRIRNSGQVAGSAIKAMWSLNRDGSDVDFEAGSILVGKQQNWTTSASTIDAYMSFSITENESVYERMRLLPGGQLIVGSTTTSHTDETKVILHPSGGQTNTYNMSATNEWWIMNNLASNSGYTTKIDFRTQNTSRGYIGITGSTVIYYSNSDYRLKENYNYDFDATSLVKAMKPLEFTWKEEPMVGKQMGFLAHELKEVTPYVVQGDKDEMREDGEIRPQVVDQGKLVAVLTKALQEAITRIEALENN